MEMNKQFTITGQNNYKVDGIFGPTDYILPINTTGTHFEEILKSADQDGRYCHMECHHKNSVECARENFKTQNFACCFKAPPMLPIAQDMEKLNLNLSPSKEDTKSDCDKSSKTRSTNQNSTS